MKELRRIVALMFLCMLVATVIAQSAKVIQLTPAEAAEAKRLYEQQIEIAEQIRKFNDTIRTRHLAATETTGSASAIMINGKFMPLIDGWDGGRFQYSEDFRFIVPVVDSNQKPAMFGCSIPYINPASGTSLGQLLTQPR
jgi:hypothetical protein